MATQQENARRYQNDLIVLPPTQIATRSSTDDQLVELWLHGRSPHTQRAYRGDLAIFRSVYPEKLFSAITLADLVAFAECLKDHYSTESQRRILYTIKSVFGFGQKTGYLIFNVAAALRVPKPKNTLAERILTEAEVIAMITLTTSERDKILLNFLYTSGGRASEVCNLKWSDLRAESAGGGYVTIYGKGDKTRTIKIGAAAWVMLQKLKKSEDLATPIFLSYRHRALEPSMVWKIVKEAADRAGIKKKVSPHWFRHSHATHALDRGAKPNLITETLGHASAATTFKYLHIAPGDSSSLYLLSI